MKNNSWTLRFNSIQKKRNLNYELINQDVVVDEVKETNSQNSYQKNLEMIQQQQQQQQQQH